MLTAYPASETDSDQLDPYEIDIRPYTRRVRQHWRIVVVAALVGGALGVAVARLTPAKFTSDATFLPQSSQASGAGALAGMAAQLGLSLPTTQPTSSPAFYADLVTSRGILDQLATVPLPGTRDASGHPILLIDKYGGSGSPAARLESAVKALRRRVGANVLAKTGVVAVTATTDSPTLSAAMVNRLLALVSEFNLRSRKSQATAEREFVEKQTASAANDLRAAEDRLRIFLTENQAYRSSSAAAVTHDRLERDVNLKQQLYTGLAEALQRARIEEVRDTPVITIVDPTSLPAVGRHGSIAFGAAGLILGALAALVYAIWRD